MQQENSCVLWCKVEGWLENTGLFLLCVYENGAGDKVIGLSSFEMNNKMFLVRRIKRDELKIQLQEHLGRRRISEGALNCCRTKLPMLKRVSPQLP